MSRAKLQGLYGIVGPPAGAKGEEAVAGLLRLARAFLDGGAPVLQLRAKDATGATLLEYARVLRKLTAEAGALFIVNDRVDVALAAEADGVHVGQNDLSVADARAAAKACGRGEGFLVGLSTHDLAQVRAGVEAGADYLGFGPIYPTTSKADALAPKGIGLLREAVGLAADTPLVAIGGITLERAPEVAATGVAMAAVISDVAAHRERAARAAALHAVFVQARLEG